MNDYIAFLKKEIKRIESGGAHSPWLTREQDIARHRNELRNMEDAVSMTSASIALTWYVIINASRQCLAVYGGALRDMAEQKLAELRAQFPLALIDMEEREFSYPQRPHVGEYV